MSKADRYDEVITQLHSFFRKYDLGVVGKMATIWYVHVSIGAVGLWFTVFTSSAPF
jgi:hypothetical protein